jgi:hypothetical protein
VLKWVSDVFGQLWCEDLAAGPSQRLSNQDGLIRAEGSTPSLLQSPDGVLNARVMLRLSVVGELRWVVVLQRATQVGDHSAHQVPSYAWLTAKNPAPSW